MGFLNGMNVVVETMVKKYERIIVHQRKVDDKKFYCTNYNKYLWIYRYIYTGEWKEHLKQNSITRILCRYPYTCSQLNWDLLEENI